MQSKSVVIDQKMFGNSKKRLTNAGRHFLSVKLMVNLLHQKKLRKYR